MKTRSLIMLVTFVGLHVPLIALTVAAIILELPEARLILGIAFASTLGAVALTLGVVHSVLPKEAGRPATQAAG